MYTDIEYPGLLSAAMEQTKTQNEMFSREMKRMSALIDKQERIIQRLLEQTEQLHMQHHGYSTTIVHLSDDNFKLRCQLERLHERYQGFRQSSDGSPKKKRMRDSNDEHRQDYGQSGVYTLDDESSTKKMKLHNDSNNEHRQDFGQSDVYTLDDGEWSSQEEIEFIHDDSDEDNESNEESEMDSESESDEDSDSNEELDGSSSSYQSNIECVSTYTIHEMLKDSNVVHLW